MRHIDRLAMPQILQERGEAWTQSFVNEWSKNPSKRPVSSKYRHREILECLEQMSAHKCFYCEKKLSRAECQVDHHIEVAVEPEKAFDWDNLYLACDACNKKKLNNSKIPITHVLDPCIYQDHEIEEHLTFEENLIYPRNDSVLGSHTIKKYRLDSEHLDYLRLQAIHEFWKVLDAIKDKIIAEKRNEPNDFEKEQLRLFANKNRRYSLMFKILLTKIGYYE